MAEGVGNPVYDSFNEGQPLEDVCYHVFSKNIFATSSKARTFVGQLNFQTNIDELASVLLLLNFIELG